MDPHRDFPDLVRDHQDLVFSVALRLTGNRADAEDAAQESFLNAFRALGRYDAERRAALQARPWLGAITVNVCRNRARSAARRPLLADHPTAGDDATSTMRSPADSADEQETAAALTAALRRLSEPQRRAVVLHHAGGLTYVEVAAALGRPEGTVKADVHRGLATLRSILEPREPPA